MTEKELNAEIILKCEEDTDGCEVDIHCGGNFGASVSLIGLLVKKIAEESGFNTEDITHAIHYCADNIDSSGKGVAKMARIIPLFMEIARIAAGDNEEGKEETDECENLFS